MYGEPLWMYRVTSTTRCNYYTARAFYYMVKSVLTLYSLYLDILQCIKIIFVYYGRSFCARRELHRSVFRQSASRNRVRLFQRIR